MNIYFSASIRAGRENAQVFEYLVKLLSKYGKVLTEHIGDVTLPEHGESKDIKYIYKRDMNWIKKCDLFIAEVSTPSTGVGYELRFAEELGKPVLCLYNENSPKKLSGMIEGNPNIRTIQYSTLKDLGSQLIAFLN